MRFIARLIASTLLFSLTGNAFAYCYTAMQGNYTSSNSGTSNTAATPACRAIIDTAGIARYPGSSYGASSDGKCYYYHATGGNILYFGTWVRGGDTPESTCEVNECQPLTGQSSGWRKTWPSFDDYNSDPGKPKCTTSQNGCALDICDSPSTSCGNGVTSSMCCGQDGKTGEYACFGNGSYTGQKQEASDGGDVDGCTGAECVPPPPTSSDSSQECTTPSTVEGVTTYTCVSQSNANEWSSSNCSVGTVNGVQGLHCTSPDYVPESDTKTRTDEVSEQTNPDGGKTTTTNTTNDRTQCKAGNCTTTSNSGTTTTTTDGSGKVTGETSTCTGDNCGSDGKPSEEEEDSQGEMPGSATMPSTSDFLPEIGGDDDQDYGEALTGYYDRILNAPIVAAFTSVVVPSGGSCSFGSASLFGGSVSFNTFCELAPEVLQGLRYLFLAIWAWAAIRLFGTA